MRRSSVEPWRRPGRTLPATRSGARRATRCTPTPRCSASSPRRSRRPSRSSQHAALRLTARGWETPPLPAPDGSGAFVVALDLRAHEAVVEHSDGRARARRADARPAGRRGHARRCSAPSRALGGAGRDRPDAAGGVVDRAARRGRRARDLRRRRRSRRYFAAATRAALVLAAFRAPYRGRSTPVNAWWGSFDLAVEPVLRPSPPSRRRTTSSCATRWTPRRSRSAGGPATRATARPRSTPTRTRRPRASRGATLSPAAARWDGELGEYVLDWDDVVAARRPARRRARRSRARPSSTPAWSAAGTRRSPASAEGTPPPVV